MLPFDNQSLANYFRLMNANGLAQVYPAALEAGILDAIAEEPLALDELCQRRTLHPRGTRVVLDVLAASGLATQEGEQFAATPLLATLLAGTYRELGEQYWQHLPELLRSGGPMAKMDAVAESAEHYQTQAAALGCMMVPAAQEAAEYLQTRLPEATPLEALDVGAGSAVWSLALAKVNPAIEVTAVDWPAVLEVAQQFAAFAGLSDRLACVEGNYHEVELSAGKYQLAIVANVTHLESAERTRQLFERLRPALAGDGQMVVIDALAETSEQDHLAHALYRLGLALRTESAEVHSQATLEKLLSEAGYCEIEYHPLAAAPRMVGLLVAKTGSRLERA